MPEARKRKGHHSFQKPSDIPGRQRTKGRITWAILFAVFGLLISLFAAGSNYVVMAAGAIAGAFIGFFVGRNMEKNA